MSKDYVKQKTYVVFDNDIGWKYFICGQVCLLDTQNLDFKHQNGISCDHNLAVVNGI